MLQIVYTESLREINHSVMIKKMNKVQLIKHEWKCTFANYSVKHFPKQIQFSFMIAIYLLYNKIQINLIQQYCTLDLLMKSLNDS